MQEGTRETRQVNTEHLHTPAPAALEVGGGPGDWSGVGRSPGASSVSHMFPGWFACAIYAVWQTVSVLSSGSCKSAKCGTSSLDWCSQQAALNLHCPTFAEGFSKAPQPQAQIRPGLHRV